MKSVNSNVYKATIRALKEARQRAGLSQQEVARRLGRPQSFIAKYERGERRIDVAEFIEIADAISANPVRLFAKVALRRH